MKKIIAFFRELGKDIGERRVTVFAAAADYYIFMSLVPILMLLLSLIRFLPVTEAELLANFAGAMPDSAYRVVENVVISIYRDGGAALTISVVLTLWSASSAMRAIMKGLDAVYGVTRREHVAVFFVRAMLYMVLFVIVVLASVIILVYGAGITSLVERRIPDSSLAFIVRSVTRAARYGIVLVLLTGVFWLMYKWMPAGRHPSSCQWPGALFSAVAWVAFSWGFSLYVGISNKFGAYGWIGAMMVAMMWMYYCLMFLLIGGCLNAYCERKRKRRDEA